MVLGDTTDYRVDQPYQIAVLTDFCNECGNCVTACPTSGDPYRDKPRLYLDRPDFEAEKGNAFWFARQGDAAIVEARWDGETHRMSINGTVEYASPALNATLESDTLAVLSVEAGAGALEGQHLSLERAAAMYALWRGLHQSMPQVPIAGAEGTKVSHPGYPE